MLITGKWVYFISDYNAVWSVKIVVALDERIVWLLTTEFFELNGESNELQIFVTLVEEGNMQNMGLYVQRLCWEPNPSSLTEVRQSEPVPGLNECRGEGWFLKPLMGKSHYSWGTWISSVVFCVLQQVHADAELQLSRYCSDICEPQRGAQA